MRGCACRKYARSAENIVKARGLVNHTLAPVTCGCHGKREEEDTMCFTGQSALFDFVCVCICYLVKVKNLFSLPGFCRKA